MAHPIFLLFLLYFRGFYCEISDLPENIVLDESVINVTKICEEKKCIPKCCGKNEMMIMLNLSCSSTNITNSYLENIPLYDNYYNDKKVNKKLRDAFFLVPNKFYDSEIFTSVDVIETFIGYNVYLSEKVNKKLRDVFFLVPNKFNDSEFFTSVDVIETFIGSNVYLSEGGILYSEFPNIYSRWTAIESSHFCVDVDKDTMEAHFVSIVEDGNTPSENMYYPICLIISSVFLFLVLLVYMILPELQNLAGRILMAYIFSLLMAFISLTCMKLGEFEKPQCIQLTAFIYFFFLSTFCWMSVMSYDIWWTFRDYAKARKINRRGEVFKFRMYCIYAWGVPLIMTIGLVVINSMNLSHIPWFVQPQLTTCGCFLTGGQQFIYMYIPILILIICNWLFFLMTAFNIWRLVRGCNILNSAHRSQKNRLVVYFKLSVIMGINWLLEVLSVLAEELSIWTYTDLYNILIGSAIFLIFVCKPKIYRKLKARFNAIFIVKKKTSPQRKQCTGNKSDSENNVTGISES